MLLRKHERGLMGHNLQIWFPEAINTPDDLPAVTARRSAGGLAPVLAEAAGPRPGHGAGATAATRPSPGSGVHEGPDNLGQGRG